MFQPIFQNHSQNTTQQQRTYMSKKGSHWTGNIKKHPAI